MKHYLSIAAAALLSLCAAAAPSSIISVESKGVSLVLDAPVGGQLEYVYFGPLTKLSDALGDRPGHMAAYPVFGQGELREYALAVTHADGNMSLELKVESVSTSSDGVAKDTRIRLKDPKYPFWVTVCYRSYSDVAMIETWTEIEHQEKKIVTLNRFDSAYLPIRVGDVWCSHLYGSWADDSHLVSEKLNRGILMIENKDGVRNSATSHAEVMFSLDGKPSETSGHVIGAALCYSGNYEIRVHTDTKKYHGYFAGISADNSAYPLKSGESFVTPTVALTYSTEGTSGASRNFHSWARAHRLIHGDKVRPILLNSWEGVYFDVNEPKMEQMMKDISSMGGELFVMDDGWFGEKYPRLNEKSSLGDWKVDRNKLPNGVPWLVNKAKENGIKFGIWLEPEMVSSVSELYEKHPDWVINAPGRDEVHGRGGTQMVLDLCNPAVQDYVFGVVDDMIRENPELGYIKWDSNMAISSFGSHYLKPGEQSRLYIDYHKGLQSVCKRLREKYPDIIIQSCASGGARVNMAYLPYFDEFWTSDNTDALQRVYMQWGASYFFPSLTLACHISASPNHQTGRLVNLKFRTDVAMMGRLGMEIQPRDMTEEERDFCRRAIADYKSVRKTIQMGDIYRLVSPYDNGELASLMYCSPDKNEAVFYWWQLQYFKDQMLPRVKMAGLDPDKSYRITELNRLDSRKMNLEGKTFTGAYLMQNGLEISLPGGKNDLYYRNCLCSRVLKLTAVE